MVLDEMITAKRYKNLAEAFRRANLSDRTYQNVRSGKFRPSARTLQRLAEVFGRSPGEVLDALKEFNEGAGAGAMPG